MCVFPFVFICIYFVILTQGSIIIGILSAPEHFERRLSVRRTWLKLLNPNSAKYYFVLGSNMCPIPPEYRKDPYGCEATQLQLNVDDVSTSSKSSSKTCISRNSHGFGFQSFGSLTVTALGVTDSLLASITSPVRVKLHEVARYPILASVTFTPNGNDSLKTIRPVLFPRGSVGYLTIEFSERSDATFCDSKGLKFNYFDGVTFTSTIDASGRSYPFDESSGACVNMLYSFKGINISEEKLTAWTQHIDDVYANIKSENVTFNDILFVNVTDVYDNLPNKLLYFFKFVDSAHKFDFLLKADDDSFVDLPKVMVQLRSDRELGMWWWSYFKEYWHVPLVGKWREEKYRSATYPPFPCGGGYVISQAVVRHLASTADNLLTFKGEDVSLGIWLAGLQVKRHTGEPGEQAVSYRALMLRLCEIHCEWTCESVRAPGSAPTCNLVQLSVPDMYEIWRIY